MPLLSTLGAASAQAFGAGSFKESKLYVEDVFSTWLYTGNGSSQTITNGIDLAGKGGMTWIKKRGPNANYANNVITDTVRGVNKGLFTDQTSGQWNGSPYLLTSFLSDGFSVSDPGNYGVNESGSTYASWTFRKAPKFFDVLTYTGSGSTQSINHNLGVAPGLIIIKRTDGPSDWSVFHRSSGSGKVLFLNATSAEATSSSYWNNTNPTSTQFTLGSGGANNNSGQSYVAYLFAHDTTADGVIQCGSFTNSSNTVNLGWEPQYVLIKRTDGASGWLVFDNMRGMPASGTSDQYLEANTSNSEANGGGTLNISSTGFTAYVGGFVNWVYMAIRRGPMRTPTDATKVFKPNIYTGTGTTLPITAAGFPPDFLLTKSRTSGNDWCVHDKLRGPSQFLTTDSTAAESNLGTNQLVSFDQNGVTYGSGSSFVNFSGATYVNHFFRRAPGFFDVTCYSGTGVARTVSHNLGVAPELMIVKERTANTAGFWTVYSQAVGNTKYLQLQSNTTPSTSVGVWNDTTPTASVFTVGSSGIVNGSGSTFVAYLFASCPGVSKVGSYTGTGTTQQINCGFTAGARFVLIKRTDSTGSWYVYDSARGIIAGNDPYLLLNSTAAEVTGTDYVDAFTGGFELSSTAPAELNANGGTYIYLAIA